MFLAVSSAQAGEMDTHSVTKQHGCEQQESDGLKMKQRLYPEVSLPTAGGPQTCICNLYNLSYMSLFFFDFAVFTLKPRFHQVPFNIAIVSSGSFSLY